MPEEIRIYFEGHRLLKPGFAAFFRELRERARELRCGLVLISARSGEEARHDFEMALATKPEAWSILLRDSEGPLPQDRPVPHSDRTFWMVEMMEAWFHADPAALARFYGKGFRRATLKANPNVEEIPKRDLKEGLKMATVKTQKGNYYDRKTEHGPRLLAAIDPALVRQAAPNCEHLFQTVLNRLK